MWQAADVMNIDEEEVINKLSNLKVETLNPETGEKVNSSRISNTGRFKTSPTPPKLVPGTYR